MKHYRSMMSRKRWNLVAECRKAYLSREISHPEYVLQKATMVLESGSRTNLFETFRPYLTALVLKKNNPGFFPEEKIQLMLEDAKKQAKRLQEESYQQDDLFCGKSVIWESFRPCDEDYNSYDDITNKCVLPWKLSKDEEREFRDAFWVEFHDPYCDGRDCTGAPFTSWMRFLRCTDRTIVLHKISYDV